MLNKKCFMTSFKEKNFPSAVDIFLDMDREQQESIFSELFQKSENQRTPNAISMINRELHADKTFESFHQAWLPTEKWTSPIQEGGQKYLRFFTTGSTRIINAVSIHDPQHILTVGLHWVANKDQYNSMLNTVKDIGKEPSNQERHDRIKQIAKKSGGGFYEVKSDDNLGAPF